MLELNKGATFVSLEVATDGFSMNLTASSQVSERGKEGHLSGERQESGMKGRKDVHEGEGGGRVRRSEGEQPGEGKEGRVGRMRAYHM